MSSSKTRLLVVFIFVIVLNVLLVCQLLATNNRIVDETAQAQNIIEIDLHRYESAHRQLSGSHNGNSSGIVLNVISNVTSNYVVPETTRAKEIDEFDLTRNEGQHKSLSRRREHPAGPAPNVTKRHNVWKGWEQPVVLEEYKLAFFRVPKVAQTTFMQLFLRMNNFTDWNMNNTQLVHNAARPILKLLGDFPLDKATEIMTSPNYTRAIFVRDPVERLLSAYLDRMKGNYGLYAARACCKEPLLLDKNRKDRAMKLWTYCVHTVAQRTGRVDQMVARCRRKQTNITVTKEGLQCISNYSSFDRFMERTFFTCQDPHWAAQSTVIDPEFWPYINFVGHLDNAASDAKSLLETLGQDVWTRYGSHGWGKHGNESMFQSLSSLSHTQSAKTKYDIYYNATSGLEQEAVRYYKADYNHPVLGEYLKR